MKYTIPYGAPNKPKPKAVCFGEFTLMYQICKSCESKGLLHNGKYLQKCSECGGKGWIQDDQTSEFLCAVDK